MAVALFLSIFYARLLLGCAQVLRRGGYNPSRIVVMVYDDIANNALNPFPGQIFNRPGKFATQPLLAM